MQPGFNGIQSIGIDASASFGGTLPQSGELAVPSFFKPSFSEFIEAALGGAASSREGSPEPQDPKHPQHQQQLAGPSVRHLGPGPADHFSFDCASFDSAGGTGLGSEMVAGGVGGLSGVEALLPLGAPFAVGPLPPDGGARQLSGGFPPASAPASAPGDGRGPLPPPLLAQVMQAPLHQLRSLQQQEQQQQQSGLRLLQLHQQLQQQQLRQQQQQMQQQQLPQRLPGGTALPLSPQLSGTDSGAGAGGQQQQQQQQQQQHIQGGWGHQQQAPSHHQQTTGSPFFAQAASPGGSPLPPLPGSPAAYPRGASVLGPGGCPGPPGRSEPQSPALQPALQLHPSSPRPGKSKRVSYTSGYSDYSGTPTPTASMSPRCGPSPSSSLMVGQLFIADSVPVAVATAAAAASAALQQQQQHQQQQLQQHYHNQQHQQQQQQMRLGGGGLPAGLVGGHLAGMTTMGWLPPGPGPGVPGAASYGFGSANDFYSGLMGEGGGGSNSDGERGRQPAHLNTRDKNREAQRRYRERQRGALATLHARSEDQARAIEGLTREKRMVEQHNKMLLERVWKLEAQLEEVQRQQQQHLQRLQLQQQQRGGGGAVKASRQGGGDDVDECTASGAGDGGGGDYPQHEGTWGTGREAGGGGGGGGADLEMCEADRLTADSVTSRGGGGGGGTGAREGEEEAGDSRGGRGGGGSTASAGRGADSTYTAG